MANQIKNSRLIWIWLTTTLLTSLILLVFIIGPPAILMGPWDHFLLLDEAWRIHLGQVPHSDFYNPIGPLTYVFVSAGMASGAQGLNAIAAGALIFALIVTPMAVFIAFARLPKLPALFLCVFVTLLAVAVRPLGFSSEESSYAMLYNRHGWILLSLVLVQMLLPARFASQSGSTADATLSGVLLGLLLVCKISYFVIALGTMAFSFVAAERSRLRDWGARIAALCLTVLLFWGMNWISLSGYIADIAMAAAAQDAGYRIAEVKGVIRNSLLSLVVFASLGALTIYFVADRSQLDLLTGMRFFGVASIFISATVLLSAGNAGEVSGRDAPLLFIGTVVLAAWAFERLRSKNWATGRSAYALVFGVGAIFFALPTMARDVRSLAFIGTAESAARNERSERIEFSSPRLQSLGIKTRRAWKTVFTTTDRVPVWVNEGIVMLSSRINEGSRVAVLGYSDPFSYALKLKPPVGMPIWLVPGISFSPRAHPRPETVLGNADLVIVPVFSMEDVGCCHHFLDGIQSVYGPFLRQNFKEVDRGINWVLYKSIKNFDVSAGGT